MKVFSSDIVKLVVSALVSFFAAFIGSLYTGPAIETWYKNLRQPVFAPPNWLFGPVWTILYLLMGVAAFLVWREGLRNKNVQYSIVAFLIQLALNIFWSYLFFGLENPLAAFFEIVILWVAIFITILAFYRISKIAAYLLIPYILWVSFAALLNFSIFQLNQ